jgi:hypothetical protein
LDLNIYQKTGGHTLPTLLIVCLFLWNGHHTNILAAIFLSLKPIAITGVCFKNTADHHKSASKNKQIHSPYRQWPDWTVHIERVPLLNGRHESSLLTKSTSISDFTKGNLQNLKRTRKNYYLAVVLSVPFHFSPYTLCFFNICILYNTKEMHKKRVINRHLPLSHRINMKKLKLWRPKWKLLNHSFY